MMFRIQLMAENIVPLVDNKNKFIICSRQCVRRFFKLLIF